MVNKDTTINAAIVMLGIGDLSGGGGAERFFAEVYTKHLKTIQNKVTLHFICDEKTYKNILNTGRDMPHDRLTVLKKPDIFYLFSYFKILRFIYSNDIRILHIPLIAPQYLPILWFFSLLPRLLRPKLSMTQVDCGYSHKFNTKFIDLSPDDRKVYLLHNVYFKSVKLDGILSWYKLFKTTFKSEMICGKPMIRTIDSYFVDTEKFKPNEEKLKQVIWAGRLITTKHPFLFIEVVRQAILMYPDICNNWQFYLYGKGPLEESLLKYINNIRMSDIIHITNSSRMEEVFASTSIYVSTQEHENFTSLSMLEAISCGNAIIAFNVGQTDYFVKNSINGFLIDKTSPVDMSNAMARLMNDEKNLSNFARESRNLVLTQLTPDNFIKEIDRYFADIASK